MAAEHWHPMPQWVNCWHLDWSSIQVGRLMFNIGIFETACIHSVSLIWRERWFVPKGSRLISGSAWCAAHIYDKKYVDGFVFFIHCLLFKRNRACISWKYSRKKCHAVPINNKHCNRRFKTRWNISMVMLKMKLKCHIVCFDTYDFCFHRA